MQAAVNTVETLNSVETSDFPTICLSKYFSFACKVFAIKSICKTFWDHHRCTQPQPNPARPSAAIGWPPAPAAPIGCQTGLSRGGQQCTTATWPRPPLAPAAHREGGGGGGGGGDGEPVADALGAGAGQDDWRAGAVRGGEVHEGAGEPEGHAGVHPGLLHLVHQEQALGLQDGQVLDQGHQEGELEDGEMLYVILRQPRFT